jgi:hypothetical protein
MLRQWPTILLFFGFLLLPTINQVTGYPRIAPLEEYRKLEERPVPAAFFNSEKVDLLGFTGQLNKWYSDQFGTRPLWVRLRTQALYSIFRESDQVYVGKDGWLFYRSVLDRELPAQEMIPEEGRKALVAKFGRLSELLNERGIRLYILPLTTKNHYYPEYLPASAGHGSAFQFYDIFVDELIADKRNRVIDSRQRLMEAKNSGLKIYHKTDFHWTDAAAPIAMGPALADMAAYDGKPHLAKAWTTEETVMANFSGGQARALPLLRTPIEQTVGVKPTGPMTTFDLKPDFNGFEQTGVAMPASGDLLSPIIVFGDSFFDALERAGFYTNFSAFGRGRTFKNDLIQVYRNRPVGTRFMVIEFITPIFAMDNYVPAFISALEADPTL